MPEFWRFRSDGGSCSELAPGLMFDNFLPIPDAASLPFYPLVLKLVVCDPRLPHNDHQCPTRGTVTGFHFSDEVPACGVWGVGCGVWGVGCGVWGGVEGSESSWASE